MKFSPSTGCFYPDDIAYDALPDDAVETTDAIFQAWCHAVSGSTISVGEDGTLTIVAPAPPTLEQAQALKVQQLTSGYNATITGNVSFTTAAGTSASFPQTDHAKAYLAQCITAGAKSWTLNLWLDAANVPVTPFAYADLQGLAAAMESAEIPAYQELLTLIAQVTTATTVEAVEAIAWA